MSDQKLKSWGLSEAEWATMIATLEAQTRPTAAGGAERRDGSSLRHPLDVFGGLKLVLPDYRTTSHKVRIRNVSAGGLGFFHNAFVHRGTKCYLALRTLGGEGVAIGGQVTWCRFLSNRTHEVGMCSATPIDVTRFLEAPVIEANHAKAQQAAAGGGGGAAGGGDPFGAAAA